MPLLLAALLLICLGVASAAAEQTTAAQTATVVHPRWHRLVGDVARVTAGGDYLALTNAEGGISLLNKQTNDREPLSPPDCRGFRAVGFGGPWFAVRCVSADGSEQVDLYDLSEETWIQQSLAPGTCSTELTVCVVDGVGSTWIRFFEVEPGGCQSHCGYNGYLQSIASGAVEVDPADSSSAGTLDDLDAASGVEQQPCPGLPSSAYNETYGPLGSLVAQVAYWHQIGRFALRTAVGGYGTPGYLFECHSHLKLRLPLYTFASPKAVVYQSNGSKYPALQGLSLPTLRSFIVPKPKGAPVALSNTTLYTIDRGSLWAGTFAKP